MNKSSSAIPKYAKFLKALSIAIFCFALALCTNAKSMEDEHLVETGRSNHCISNDSCTHWGLKHWVCGIKEYVIDRCMCCTMCSFNSMDEDRTYKNNDYDITSDCCLIACTARYDSCCYNNPIGGTLCFPFAALTHLMCLPCACCCSTKKGTESISTFGFNKNHNNILIIYEDGRIGQYTPINRNSPYQELDALEAMRGKISRCYYGLTPGGEEILRK